MTFIYNIPIQDVTFYPRVYDAPVGSLLQIASVQTKRAQDAPLIPTWVGMRSSCYPSDQGEACGFVILSGVEAGTFVNGADLANSPAVDI